jgi:hypothetical protein
MFLLMKGRLARAELSIGLKGIRVDKRVVG